jgi:hypothetical protein
MHLITAALLTTLLGRKKGAGAGRLPSFAGVIETAHVLPGRVRFRAPGLVGRDTLAKELQKRLAKLEGIESAAVSPISGSVLLRFAPERVTPELLLGAVIRLLGLEKEIQRPPRSRIGEGIRHTGEALNRAVHEQTSGMIDLWTALAVLLVVLGIRQIAAGNRALGWPLLWWAYLSLFPPGRGHG